jgi:hypothetical protein
MKDKLWFCCRAEERTSLGFQRKRKDNSTGNAFASINSRERRRKKLDTVNEEHNEARWTQHHNFKVKNGELPR